MTNIAIVGLPGSGKTLTLTSMLARRKYSIYSNLDLKLPNVIRLRKEWVYQQVITENALGKKKVEYQPNHDYWKQLRKEGKFFDVVIDEIQNFANSRQGMKAENVAKTMWFSQIRKVLGSGEKNDFIATSQRLEAFDIGYRMLIHKFVAVEKRWVMPDGKMLPGEEQYQKFAKLIPTKSWENGKLVIINVPWTRIINTSFIGHGCYDRCKAYLRYGMKTFNNQQFIDGNKLMQYYDSYSFTDFGDSEYI